MGLTLAVGEAISVAFSICFISYSMGCFLKNRSRQLGLITTLGASKKQLNRLIFMENMLVGMLSIVTGILFGMVFSKFFLDIANRLIGVSEFTFYFPVQAMLLTVVVMGLMFLGIAYFTPKLIRKKEVIKLLKAEVKDDMPCDRDISGFGPGSSVGVHVSIPGGSFFAGELLAAFFTHLRCCVRNLSPVFFWNAVMAGLAKNKPL